MRPAKNEAHREETRRSSRNGLSASVIAGPLSDPLDRAILAAVARLARAKMAPCTTRELVGQPVIASRVTDRS
jgi:hypothetical protein